MTAGWYVWSGNNYDDNPFHQQQMAISNFPHLVAQARAEARICGHFQRMPHRWVSAFSANDAGDAA